MATSKKKTATKKVAAKKAATKKVATKAATKKAATKKAATKKAATSKVESKPTKTSPASSPAKKAEEALAKKAPAKKAPAKKAPAKKTPAKKTPAKKAPAKKATKAPKKKAPASSAPVGEMLTMEAELPAPPATVYDAWLDAAQHGAMTGATATSDPKTGGAFTAWDGYVSGSYVELFPKERILMRWRTTDFAASDEDSLLDVLFSPHRVDGKPGTRVFLIHMQLPKGGASRYASGWAEFYFAPMTAHFGG
ncbi:MAG: SRPBCC domain-containing protein [Sandaracinus sp.]